MQRIFFLFGRQITLLIVLVRLNCGVSLKNKRTKPLLAIYNNVTVSRISDEIWKNSVPQWGIEPCSLELLTLHGVGFRFPSQLPSTGMVLKLGASIITARPLKGTWSTSYSPCMSSSVADLHSKILDAPPPRGSKFFQFHAVFGKFWRNCMLAPPPWGVGAPSSVKT